ncbi:heterokaryon incompatibility protein-domain-containing protein [Pisolithus tinctorius]|uniref:Uncharacterized protein n=1 Tax=Pisolithus tinctorius Marx 270 TaxID=870435 RepID=A0A0C3IML5_PISTI|nr:heterokaryon incompatibility protein-domain-containing protein [Pisolithus tinctorius]KIN98192.1 hypothetical protein M404DRAFT_1005562 [Pisolithus tinctorius Marx 270]
MRLIDVKAFVDFVEGRARPETRLLVEFNAIRLTHTSYAILSHCWGAPEDEVQFTEMEGLTTMGVTTRDDISRRSGYRKIYGSCKQALGDKLHWLWVDTCCIDKRSSAELSEAINSMFVWYANSEVCYAFLHDVNTDVLPTKHHADFAEFNGWPSWFSRGWTLQELVAPEHVRFFNKEWVCIGDKNGHARTLNIITRISVDVLAKGLGFSRPSVAQIMSWAADRTTTREEDRAYSLLGLFGVHMPMLYGEGKNAFLRLQLEIIRSTNDQSIFAWGWRKAIGRSRSFLAEDPSDFQDCSNIEQIDRREFVRTLGKSLSRRELRKVTAAEERLRTFTVTNDGIQIWLPFQHTATLEPCQLSAKIAILACNNAQEASDPLTVLVETTAFAPLSRYFCPRTMNHWNKEKSVEFQQIFLPYRDDSHKKIRGPLTTQTGVRAQIRMTDINADDVVILFLGPMGSKKSDFIDKLTFQPERTVREVKPRTHRTSAQTHVRNGKRFVFIDTPTFEPDVTTIREISMWLDFIYRRSIKLTGVIYTHDITTDKDLEGAKHNFRILSAICGVEAADRMRLVTTTLDNLDESGASDVEHSLKAHLDLFLGAGARWEKFPEASDSAWAILEGLGEERKALQVQREMVEMNWELHWVSALRIV